MSTLVCFHAHPDDECIGTGGTIARAAAEGHRVVLVVATNGDHGEVPADMPADETLVSLRHKETLASAATLGVHRVVFLGYEDSGMTGWEQNANAGAFCNASLDEAAHKLAEVLRDENADVMTTYDWHGGYGHPDHVKAHQVAHLGAAAAERRPRLLESTMNRDRLRASFELAREAGIDDMDPDAPADDGNPFGEPEANIHWEVDTSSVLDVKRRALECHASQTSDVGFMLALPAEAFAAWFGREFYIEPGREPGMVLGRWWDA